MCGIAGFVGAPQSAVRAMAELRSMCDVIAHRGPDDAGYHVRPGVALGMRRLSIIDVAGGHQPLANEDGSVHIVFNGEIYNYRELRTRLLPAHRFSTGSDTETIVHLYEEDGDAVVHGLRGMFAFALWDDRRRRLLLARDRLGIKPLYYWDTGDGIAFASELKSLLQLSHCPRVVDGRAVADYLALGYVPEPDSIYQGIRKLEPGHILTWSREDGIRIRRYWTPFRPEQTGIREEEAVREARRLLGEAVRYRLIADVPLGAFLSGGLDSSAVVAEMGRHMDRPVQTFSIGFREPEFNEAPHAAAVARALGTDHTELIVTPDVESLFDEIIAAFDEPFADSSAIPTLLVSRLARSRVTVALSGDGGDEVFGGYTRYADYERRGAPHLPARLRAALGAAVRAAPHGLRGRNRLLELSRGLRGRYASMVAHPLRLDEGGVIRPALASDDTAMENVLQRWFEAVPARDLVTTASFVDLISYLPNDILTKVDRMSMAASLEARVPLLDHHLVEFATSLPGQFRRRDGTGKWVFREAVRPSVPAEVLTRRKQGFGVPLPLWFRGVLRPQIESLSARGAAIEEYAEPTAVRRLVGEHLTGRRDHSAMLWKLLVLQRWLTSSRAVATIADRPSPSSAIGEAVPS